MARPRVDLVVPFSGDLEVLKALRARLAGVQLREGDTVLVVDNTPNPPAGEAPALGEVAVLQAAERLTPGYARNRGAERGSAPWLVFIDADTDPAPDLLDRMFDPVPGPDTVLLVGGVRDEPVGVHAPGPARYAHLRRTLDQSRTLSLGPWAFGQTANLGCRRSAFEAVGGFREEIAAAEDADLNYRVLAAGGRRERREHAVVVHHNRAGLRAFVRQALGHGAGAGWLSRQYPGALPARRLPGLLWWGARFAAKGCWRALRSQDRDELVMALYEPLWELTFELGRRLSNERPAQRR